VVALYNRLKHTPGREITPRTVIFGGKAAPGYRMAKLIIKLITSVGDVVNRDADVSTSLKVVFLPAGKEASGTGNMKFSMNGALTIGTLDGANIEIRDAVGSENFFLFGLTADEVDAARKAGYNPRAVYESNHELREVIDLLGSGVLSGGGPAAVPATHRLVADT
jgi:starch phosphorylase